MQILSCISKSKELRCAAATVYGDRLAAFLPDGRFLRQFKRSVPRLAAVFERGFFQKVERIELDKLDAVTYGKTSPLRKGKCRFFEN